MLYELKSVVVRNSDHVPVVARVIEETDENTLYDMSYCYGCGRGVYQLDHPEVPYCYSKDVSVLIYG